MESVKPHLFISHHSLALPSLSAVSGVIALVMLVELSAAPRGGAVTFLPDDAVVACRAILPSCFQRDAWAALCADDPSVAAGHPEACRSAGFEPDQFDQGR